MSTNADTIRTMIPHARMHLLGSFAHPAYCSGCEAEAALDALLAEVERLRTALLEAADRIESDDHQIHSEWGVGPYEPDPYIEELRALARAVRR